MDVKSLEAEAIATATKHVVNMLQRPGQLEKVNYFKSRNCRKKASVEAMLKTAMQSQLDNVRLGLNQLHLGLSESSEVNGSLNWIKNSLQEVHSMAGNLQTVREENMRHSQFLTAMENMKHIFAVPENVEKCKLLISEGKLLLAHQCLIDLETSRDDLLRELHKCPNQSTIDIIILKAYFEDIEELSELLSKQIFLILSRTLNTVRRTPTEIVTALRIIEREEKSDLFDLQGQKQNGFLPPGRPKRWRKKQFEVLEKAVAQRIEGTQAEDRNDNKMWLVRYLELIRLFILEDLRVVKTLCVACFPPYDIFNKYVNMYHRCLSNHLKEVICHGLEGNEYVSLLSWIMNTYPGPELLQHPELDIDTKALGPLLDQELLDKLQDEYIKNMENNYTVWLQKTLETEKAGWTNVLSTERDEQDGYYQTSTPVIIFQMIDQNLLVTKTISPALTFSCLIMSVEQVIIYGNKYRDAILEFTKTHFEDRSLVPYFTDHIITIVNNCLQFIELAQQLKQLYWKPGIPDNNGIKIFETVLQIFFKLRDEAARYLLKEAFLDLEVHFQDLISPKWASNSIAVDTICVTLEDYFQDYVHLREKNFEHVIKEAQKSVAERYITAIFRRKVTFKSYEERREAALKIVKESEQMKAFFIRIFPKLGKIDSPFEVISNLTEILKSEDPEILSLDLHGLVDKYPDVTAEHLVQLLILRGDIGRSEAKEKVSYIFVGNKPRERVEKSIFSLIK